MKQFSVDVDFRVVKRIYVDAETAEQAEQIVKQRCRDNPYQYTSNPDYSELDAIVEVNEEEDEEEREDIDKALDYVREQLGPDKVAEIKAQVDRSYRYHMAPSDCVMHEDKVRDLLEEYGQDNHLSEGWWEDHDIDEVLMNI